MKTGLTVCISVYEPGHKPIHFHNPENDTHCTRHVSSLVILFTPSGKELRRIDFYPMTRWQKVCWKTDQLLVAMGVYAFWDIVGPTARPVRLESLADKRMAVDASIWIYQFLKAVRDKEGNAMRHSHVVGFFRRVCKLLYFGIKPVFIFDGGAPALKRQTINQRKERRQGKRDDAAKTARKLLALQMQKNKAPEVAENRTARELPSKDNTGAVIFRPHDEYHLPHIPGFKYDKDDARITSEDDFRTVMDNIDELDGLDLDSINPASKEFERLPKSTQYMILSALRLKSRLRMGYTKEQLEEIFPDSMDFSRFQIEMVKKRNFFTQRLMNVTGMDDGGSSKKKGETVNRVAGEKDKEYTLKRTENGWALSLEANDGSEVSKAIVLDEWDNRNNNVNSINNNNSDCDDDGNDMEWEDVDIKSTKREKELDYSLKASLLPQLKQGLQAAGGQSFLDKRHDFTSPVKVPNQQVNFIKDKEDDHEHAYISDDDYDNNNDSYLKQIEEMEMIEAIQRSRDTQKNHEVIEEEKEKTHIIGVLKTPDIGEGSNDHDIEFEDVEIPKISSTQDIDQGVKNAAVTSLPEEYNPVQPFLWDKASIPTESEQNLTDVVSKIPSFEFGTESLLFQGTTKSVEPKVQKKENENSERKPLPETPTWFQDSENRNSNPFSISSFVTSEHKNSDATFQTEDEKLGLVTGSRVQELIKSRLRDQQATTLSNGLGDDYSAEVGHEPEVIELDNDAVSLEDGHASEIHEDYSKTTEKPGFLDSSLSGTATRNQQHAKDIPPVVDYDFSEDEEDALVEQLRQEAKGYNTFKNNLNPNSGNLTFIEDELFEQQKKEKRDSDEVTAVMIKEIQELLSRFGIPYITAPMEAEAQCAELIRLALVDGIITDDSDVFLFGGDRVYKNMFHEKNYVEFYESGTISRDLGLNRDRMIELAQLLGSDYTEGVKGIGPVYGMEVLAEFGNLVKLKEWYNEGQFDKNRQEKESTFHKSLRRKLVSNEVILDSDFPSELVRDAYLRPEVNDDKTQFVWGKPDLDKLRTFLHENVGWPQEKSDEVLIPLIKEINNRKKHGTQKKLTDFFPSEYIKTRKELKLGKRIKEASGKLKKRRIK